MAGADLVSPAHTITRIGLMMISANSYNAILWTTKVEVPKDGVESSVSQEQIEANLDDKRPQTIESIEPIPFLHVGLGSPSYSCDMNMNLAALTMGFLVASLTPSSASRPRRNGKLALRRLG